MSWSNGNDRPDGEYRHGYGRFDPHRVGPVASQRPVSPAAKRAGDVLLLGSLAAVLAGCATVWLAAGIGGLLGHGRWPRGLGLTAAAMAVPRLVRHPGQPGLAFPVEARPLLPGAGLFWGLVVCVALFWVLTAFVVTRWRAQRRALLTGLDGTAGASGYLSGPAVVHRARTLRPALAGRKVTPREAGLLLGHAGGGRGFAVYGGVDDAYCALGPARSGKADGLLLPAVLEAPGPVLVVTDRTELLGPAAAYRSQLGPVTVFDPYHRVDIDLLGADQASDRPGRLRWSPTHGCTDPAVATRRAAALAGPGASPETHLVLRCHLHALALDGRPIRQALTWAANPAHPEPVRLLREHPGAAEGWAEQLARAGDDRASWDRVRQALGSLDSASVAQACSPGQGGHAGLARQLTGRSTLYLVGGGDGPESVAPLLAALAEEALHTVRVGGQLDPPLTVVLDDPAGCAPLPGLPELMATGPGAGLVPVVGLRSLAAARSVWGEAGAAALWDAATLRLVFGGVADPYDLERVRALAPDVDPHGLRPGQALLLHRYVQPLVVRLLDWRRRDYPATDGSRGRVRLARG